MYTYSADKVIADLKAQGFSKLPSVSSLLQQNNYFDTYKNEGELETYKENSPTLLKLIKDMNLEKLFDALYIHGKELKLKMNHEVRFISRYVKNGQVSEGYLGHFDRQFVTIVIPVSIPQVGEQFTNGELFAAPNFRGHIPSKIINIFRRLYFKKLNTKKTYLNLIKKGKANVFNFRDYEPFVFYGNRTFHGNFPLLNNKSDRLTFLCHLYDTSPRLGIRALLRKLSNR
jgi:hypothetical protein